MKTLIALIVIFSCQILQAQDKFPPPGFPALMECVYTTNNNVKLPEKSVVCADTFETECIGKGGVIINEIAEPSQISKRYCFAKSFDADAPCDEDVDCMVGCDFEFAIKANCKLEKETTLEGVSITEKIFDCNSLDPGICLPAPVYKPMNGKTIKYKIDGTKLIKTILPGPIS
jgi:hypothetical protein